VLADMPSMGPSAATYGSVTQTPVLVVNAQGIVTGISNITITPGWASITGKPSTTLLMALTDQTTCLYRASTPVTVTNTTVETSLLVGGAGTLVIPANELVVGSNIRIKLVGYWATAGTPTLRIKLKMNNNIILDSNAWTSGNSAAAVWPWRAEIVLSVKSIISGTASCSGTIYFGQYLTASETTFPPPSPAVVMTFDATIAQTLDLTFQWGVASATYIFTVSNAQVFLEG
jgi:hypothetical protein